MSDWKYIDDQWQGGCFLVRWCTGRLNLDFQLCNCGALLDLIFNPDNMDESWHELPKNWIVA